MTVDASRPNYWMRVLISLDQMIYVVVGGKHFGETISAALGVNHKAFYRRALYYVLDEIQTRHCELAMIHDSARDQDTIDRLNG